MDRRDAIKALGALASSAGLTVAPLTAREAEKVELIVLRSPGSMSCHAMENLKEAWVRAVAGTALESTRTIVLDDGITIDLIRG